MEKQGKVYLIGAGPGDLGLLTLKGAEIIRKAEVAVYDRLVGPAILDLIPAEAERINVGKNAGHHPVPQHEINQILLEKARENKTVVRIKGGDSFLFGRGGEELELLEENGVPFEVVPGITSSLSVPAYAGIPVTHRDYCSSVHIITGHARENHELHIDFESLVKLNGTLIFMMSVSTLGRIMQGLRDAGMDPAMPAAIIENGTRSNQRKFVSTISEIEQVAADNHVISPSIIAVGRVCALSDRFDWFSNQPLKGRKILVTRPKKTAGKLSELLKAQGADVCEYPCIFVEPVEAEVVSPLEEADSLVLTSANGVEAFFEKLCAAGKDARALFGKKVYAVGSQTAAAILKYGIRADFVPSVFDGKHLAEELISEKILAPGEKLLIAGAAKGGEEMMQVFDKHQIFYRKIVVYHTVFTDPAGQPEIDPADFDYVTFTSASCVHGFVNAMQGKMEDFSSVQAICIGQQTAKAAEQYGMQIFVSKEATLPAMTACVMELAESK